MPEFQSMCRVKGSQRCFQILKQCTMYSAKARRTSLQCWEWWFWCLERNKGVMTWFGGLQSPSLNFMWEMYFGELEKLCWSWCFTKHLQDLWYVFTEKDINIELGYPTYNYLSKLHVNHERENLLFEHIDPSNNMFYKVNCYRLRSKLQCISK